MAGEQTEDPRLGPPIGDDPRLGPPIEPKEDPRLGPPVVSTPGFQMPDKSQPGMFSRIGSSISGAMSSAIDAFSQGAQGAGEAQIQQANMRPGDFEDSAFKTLNDIHGDLKDATRGLHMEEGFSGENGRPGEPSAWARYVDKDGKPVDVEDVESGKIPKDQVTTEDPFNYFIPSLRGRPTSILKTNEGNAVVAAALGSGDPSLLQQAHAGVLGVKELYADPQHGAVYKGLATMNLPQQLAARGTIAALEQVGAMDPQYARSILSKEEVHPSDWVAYYQEKSGSDGATSRIGWGLLGGVADMIFDPVMSVGSGFKKLDQAAEIGGKLVTDLGTVSRAERAQYEVSNGIERVIRANGDFTGSGEKVAGTLEQNLAALDQWKANPTWKAGGMTLNELSENVNASPGVSKYIAGDAGNAFKMSSTAQEFADGTRKMGFKIPFTNTALEIPFFSSTLEQFGQKSADAYLQLKTSIGSALNSAAAASMENKAMTLSGFTKEIGGDVARGVVESANFISNSLTKFATQTGRPLFNAAASVFMNDKEFASYQMSKFKDDAYKTFSNEAGEVDRHALQTAMDVLDYEPQRADEWYAEKKGGDLSAEDYSKLQNGRAVAAQRRGLLSQSQNDWIDEIQKQNLAGVEALKNRNLPFFELDPLKEGNNATGYVKHILTKEYASQFRDSKEAADSAEEFVSNMFGSPDRSALARKIQEPVSKINASYQAAGNEMKMFVDDPIYAHAVRMQEMQDLIRKHDFLHSIDDLLIYRHADDVRMPVGYVPFDPEKVGQSAFRVMNQDKEPLKWFDQFLPERMGDWFKEGNQIYMPEDVATRVQYALNPYLDRSKNSVLMKTMQGMQYFFKNGALFGPGYLGTKFSSHFAASLYSGTSMDGMFDALKLLTPSFKEAEPTFEIAGQSLSRDEATSILSRNGMLGRNIMSPADKWDAAIENMSKTSDDAKDLLGKLDSAGGKIIKGIPTVLDHAMLFRMNRALSEGVDDISKAAHFISKLKEGYTEEGAAESANFWFYDYKQGGSYQKGLAQVMPFSTTGIKTLEQTFQSIREGNMAHLTLPNKVSDIMSGVYVDDADTRKFIRESVPNYQKDATMGPLLPGGRELVQEFPWIFHTVKALWSPLSSERDELHDLPINPLMKLPMLTYAALHEFSQQELGNGALFREVMTQMASDYLPPVMKHALTMYQIQHPEESHLIDFGSWYVPRGAIVPTKSPDSISAQKLENAATFGNWIENKYGQNAFMNMWLHGSPEDRKQVLTGGDRAYQNLLDSGDEMATRREESVSAGLGNYVRSRVRALTLGQFTATPLDVDIFSRMAAMNKQQKAVVDQFKSSNMKMGFGLVSPEALDDPKSQADIKENGTQEQKDLMARHDSLTDKMAALIHFYDFAIKDGQEQTGILRQIMGTEQNKVHFSELSGESDKLNVKERYRKLLETPEGE